MKKNYIDEIAQVNPQAAMALANAPFMDIKNFVDQFNNQVAAITGIPVP